MQKTAFAGLEKLKEIQRTFPTPFHLYDEAGIRQTANAVNQAFRWNGGFKEYYAVKACPNPFILKLLKEEGCGVDCASVPELMLAQAVGLSGDDIMFSANETKAEEYLYARRMNAIINLDDITHIDFLAANGGLPEKLCLRYNPGGDLTVGNTCMGHPEEAKYGMTRAQIFDAVRSLQQRGVKRFGLHALLASNATEGSYYPENASVLFTLAADLHSQLGADIFMVNLSGGVGIGYRPEEQTPDIGLIGAEIKACFERIMVPAGLQDTHVCSELGRYVTGPHGILVASAIHEKHIYREYIGLDACACDLMRPAIYGAYHHITIPGKEDMPCDHIYDVVGSLCENNDKFAVQRPLPKIDMGDLVVIHDTGAHGYSMGYNYNGKLKSAEVLLHPDGSFSMIRRAETPKDYFATFDFCDILKDFCINMQIKELRLEKGMLFGSKAYLFYLIFSKFRRILVPKTDMEWLYADYAYSAEPTGNRRLTGLPRLPQTSPTFSRMRLRMRLSMRETCTCDTPISRAISLWVCLRK